MAEADTASLNLYLPGHLARVLKHYAKAQGQSVGKVVDDWLSDLPAYAESLTRQNTLNLPQVSTNQQRLLVQVAPQNRQRLNTSAALLRSHLAEPSLTARRLVRGLIEERLQALGKL